MTKAVPNAELRLHRIWSSMKQRCCNSKSKDYQYYGGKGIAVCEDWQEFEPFYYWARANGYKDGLTIERKDINKGYSPDNCTWIPRHKQQSNTSRNRRYEVYGKEFTITELCRLYNVPRSTVSARLKRGSSIEQALTQNGRQKMNNQLLELSDKLKELRERKSDLDAQTKALSNEIDQTQMEMVDLMMTEELTSFNRNGVTFSLVTQEYPSPEPERKGELWEAMKENVFEDLFTINSQTLSATVKELIANNDGILPDWLNGLIKIAEKNTIRVAKSKKY
jgi:predicted DNA-binding protein YlxM (UPF0122 family)